MIDKKYWSIVVNDVVDALCPIYQKLPIEKAAQILGMEEQFYALLDNTIFDTDDGFEQKLKFVFDQYFIYMGNWVDHIQPYEISEVRKLLKAPNGN